MVGTGRLAVPSCAARHGDAPYQNALQRFGDSDSIFAGVAF